MVHFQPPSVTPNLGSWTPLLEFWLERCNCQVWSSKSDRRSYITLITVVCLLQYRRFPPTCPPP